MKTLVAVLLLATGSALAAPSVLRHARDVQLLTDADYARHIPFEMHGKVIETLHRSSLILEDGTGRISIHLDITNRIANGDFVTLSGRSEVNDQRKNHLFAYSYAKTGSGEPVRPVAASLEDIIAGKCNLMTVRTSATVTDTFKDEIDPQYGHMTLYADGRSIDLAFLDAKAGTNDYRQLVNAEIAVTAVCVPQSGGWRIFNGTTLHLANCDDITVLKPAPSDPFEVEPLGDIHHISPEVIAGMGRRRIDGRVIAIWHDDRIMVRTASGTPIQVTLAHGRTCPAFGETVRVFGFPNTDLFNINLDNAIWRPENVAGLPAEPAVTNMTAEALLADEHGKRRFNMPFHGRTVRLRGIVRNIPSPEDEYARLHLECGNFVIPVDASGVAASLPALTIGTEVELTGMCLMEVDNWVPTAPFPRVKSFTLVLRTPDDVRILSRPPWWTPARLLVVICSLLAALIAIGIWNRTLRRLVERRSRQLVKEQVAHRNAESRREERTRLAVELHDSLSQNLAAVAFQISSAESARAAACDAKTGAHLKTAERMLDSCRTELRHCLWDLRGDALDAHDFQEAIRQTVETVRCDASVDVDFRVARTRLNDSVAHAALMIVRELVSNAVRHGKARLITIRGTSKGGFLVLTVTDDGTGFDVSSCPGIREGHFGLEGIRQRVKRLDGDVRISSSRSKGTAVTLSINLKSPNET